MNVIYSVLLCLFFKSSSCQLQCVKETLQDKEFSIEVPTHIKVKCGDCIEIPYEITFPMNKVTVPYRKIWFKGDPQNDQNVINVDRVESETKDIYRIDALPRGEYEYGFKLEWGCNQTYIFPLRVKISVSALTTKPNLWIPPLEEGKAVILRCIAPRLCYGRAQTYWTKKTADGQSIIQDPEYIYSIFNKLNYVPTSDDHNTNITCVADYGFAVAETTVTLNVKFAPIILNSSQCVANGKLVVCVCISRGNPLPPITWPSAVLTDFSVTSSSSILTVSSTFTLPLAAFHNTTARCISSNEKGQAEIDIPLQNYTNNFPTDLSDGKLESTAATAWVITGVSISLNLVLLTTLIICINKRDKHTQKKACEETDTYASLRLADVEQEYGVISPQPR